VGVVPVQFRELTVKVAAAAVQSASPIPGSDALTEAILRDLLNVQDEQLIRLERIEGDVARLVDGSWQTGRRYLREAALPGRTSAQVKDSLEHAKEHFTEAADLQPAESMRRSTVLLDVALVCMLLNDRQLSAFYARDAALEARAS
jgi:hypothetical protein